MNILLVEPDKILGGATVGSLQDRGHRVVWHRSGQSALDSLDQQMPDVIIIEIQLGIHNGIEFLYELRSYPEWQNIPVIVHTINDHVTDRHFSVSFEELGVETVLYKPRTTAHQLGQAVGQFDR